MLNDSLGLNTLTSKPCTTMRFLLAIGAGRLPFRASCFPPVGCPKNARLGDYVDGLYAPFTRVWTFFLHD